MSLYPTLNLNTLADEINTASTTESTKEIGKVFLCDFLEGNKARIVIENGKPKPAETIKEKIQMYVQVLLRTELDKFEIYENTGFGMTYFKYRGFKLPKSYILSELKREITENIKKISLVDSINNFQASLTETTININFEIILNDGTILTISS